MRTLEEFQKEVLAPLRKERDDKHAAALKIKTDAGAAFAKRKKEIVEKEGEYKEYQKLCLKEFLSKQALEKKSFFVLQDAERTDAHAQYLKANQEYKAAKRRANEEYMDKLAVAFAEYNKDRVAAGEQPVSYDNCREKSPEGCKAVYSENGWPADPAQEAEA
jgi:hypothetical protein